MAFIVDLKNNFWKITLLHVALVWSKLKRLAILILCTRLLELVTLITLIASFLLWHASLILKIIIYITGKSHCYSLGMVKIEAFDDSHFMHQTGRACHTDHTDSIVSSMAFIADLKNNFYITGKSHC